jgi:hypothetical protein
MKIDHRRDACDLFSQESLMGNELTTKDEDLGAHLQACQALSQREQARWATLPGYFRRSKGTSKAGECRIENLRYPERGHVTYDIVCGKKAARIKAEYRYTESTFEGTTRMVSEGRSFTQKMKGRYVGPCKK